MLLPMSSTGKKRRGNRLLADELPLLFFPTGRVPCSEETRSVYEVVLRIAAETKGIRKWQITKYRSFVSRICIKSTAWANRKCAP